MPVTVGAGSPASATARPMRDPRTGPSSPRNSMRRLEERDSNRDRAEQHDEPGETETENGPVEGDAGMLDAADRAEWSQR